MVSAGDHLVEDLKTKSDLAHDNEKIELIYSLTSDHNLTLGERPSASIWLVEIIIESWRFIPASYHNQKVGVGSRENRNVHRDAQSVRLVETDTKVPLTAQQQEDEDANVHEAHASCRSTQTYGLYSAEPR